MVFYLFRKEGKKKKTTAKTTTLARSCVFLMVSNFDFFLSYYFFEIFYNVFTQLSENKLLACRIKFTDAATLKVILREFVQINKIKLNRLLDIIKFSASDIAFLAF